MVRPLTAKAWRTVVQSHAWRYPPCPRILLAIEAMMPSDLEAKEIQTYIAGRCNQRREVDFDEDLCKERHVRRLSLRRGYSICDRRAALRPVGKVELQRVKCHGCGCVRSSGEGICPLSP